MNAAEHSHDEQQEPEASVLGSLPRERPGRRSPRRQAGDRGPATVEQRRRGVTEQAEDEPARGVEDLAWAGIAVAAEAATLGVRLANRVLGAGSSLRKRGS